MSTRAISLVILFSFSFLKASVLCQTEKKLRARDLFLSSEAQASTKSEQATGSKTDGKATAPIPLGLRYSILKQVRDNQVAEVDPDSVFHSGDRIRLSIQSNDSGYLYIVLRGTSGRWTLLFPAKEILGGKNTVEKGDRYEIPLRDVWFVFDEKPGIEKLFLVLSRKREPDLENLIQSSGQDRKTETAQGPSGKEMVPSLEDVTVGKIRGQVAARDLVFEKVSEGSSGETAVYVVNHTAKANSRVVVDLNLTHQ